MKTLTLTKVYNPLNRADKDIIQWQFNKGAKLADLINSQGCFFNKPDSCKAVVSINGTIIPEKLYNEIELVENQHITMVPVLHGGGDSKSIFRMIGMVILTIVASIVSYGVVGGMVMGGYLSSSIGIYATYGIVFASIMVAGSMALNAMLPTAGAQMPALNGFGSSSQSNSYSWSPQTTQQQGLPIPVAYGDCKLTGNAIGVFRETIGNKSYLNVLLAISKGPLYNITNIQLNLQDISNYNGVDVYTRLGYLNQDVIPNFGDTVTEYPQGTKVSYGTPVLYTTIGSDFDALSVEVACPNGLYYYNDNGTISDHSVTYSVEISPAGAGTWTSITNSAASIANVDYNGRWSAGKWVWSGGPGIWGHFVWQEISAGTTYIEDHIDGEIYSTGVTWRWMTAAAPTILGGIVPNVTMKAAQRSIVSHTWRADNLTSGKYDVRITRVTADETDVRYSDDFYLIAVREIVLDDFIYPETALVGLRALATDQLSGSFSFSCRTLGKMCRIYDGVTWTVGSTSNPAWIVFDILTQPVFDETDWSVIGYESHYPSSIDIDRFLEWAEYCDDLVPDGSGGIEPRLTYNGVFDSTMSMWDAALSVAKIGRGAPYWRGTVITVAIDKPSDPVALVSVGNIEEDSFEEVFLSMENRAGSIEVDFLNIEKNLERDKMTIYNPDAPAEWGTTSLPLQGVIKPSEVWRHCRYYLATTQLLTRVVGISMDIDAIAFTIGDVINVQHDVPQWGQAGGRIVSATNTTVTLDKSIVVESGKSYSVMIRLIDGTVVTRNITNAVGSHTVLNVSVPFSTVPQAYDVFGFGEVNLVVKPMRVTSIDPKGDLKRSITLTDYNESIYNSDMLEPVIPTQNYSQLKLSKISGLELTERMVKSIGGRITTYMDIKWNLLVPNSVDKYIEVLRNNQIVESLDIGATGSSIEVKDGENVTIHVRTVGWIGNKQDLTLAASKTVYVIGKTARPADVTGLVATTTASGALRLDWDKSNEVDIDYYQVAVSTSSEWTRSIDATKSYSSTITIPAAKDGTYMVKAVDTGGRMSENAASVDVVMPTNGLYHLQQSIVEETAFSGTKTGCTVSGGTLNLDIATLWDGTSSVGYYESATVIDLGSVQTARCLCSLDFTCVDNQTGINSILSLDAITSLDLIGVVGTAEGCEIEPQIALSQDGTIFGPWQRFSIGDYVGRKFKFRVKMTSHVETVYTKISALHFDLYLQYRNQVMPNVSLAASPATSVAFTPVFIGTPMVRATVQNATSGDTVKISNITTSNFEIQVLNAGVGVARTVDIEAIGY